MARGSTLALLCFLVSITAFVLGLVANLRVSDLHNEAATISVPVRGPTFRVKGNMVTLQDGTPCVPSAGLPAGMTLKKSKVSRVEGRFHMIRAADKTAAAGDALPVVSDCSNPIAAGARWRQPYKIILDPTNNAGIPRDQIVDLVWRGVNEVVSRMAHVIVEGQDTVGCADGFDDDSPDGKNEIMFGFVEDESVIAVTVDWGIFSGPEDQREIVESDILFNLHLLLGNASAQPGVFDIWGMSSHEFMHSVGIGHTDTDGATMFPTASPGETHKRDLLPCEAVGLCDHYSVAGKCENFAQNSLPPFVDVGPSSRCGVFPNGPSAAASTVAAAMPLLLATLLCVALLV